MLPEIALITDIYFKIEKALSSFSIITSMIICITGVLIIGCIDYKTKYQMSFSIFYVLPIGYATWFSGKKAGLGVAFFAVIVWITADLSAGHIYSHPFVPVWNTLARLTLFVIISILLSLIRDKLDKEEQYADTDYLTGLHNSRAFYEKIDEESTRSRRYGHPFTIAYIDLDNFKYVNDTFGHNAGDAVLKAIADFFKMHIRKSDVISRIGGDEFACLFPETDYEMSEAIIRKMLPGLKESMDKNSWPITFSIGMISYMKPMATSRDMIKAVDDLMYNIKKQGKNNIVHEKYV